MNKNKNIFLITLIFIIVTSSLTILSAQPPTGPKIKKLGKNYIFADETHLRSSTDEENEILLSLHGGEEIELLSETKIIDECDGVENFWYEVSARDKVGYIDGGSLSDLFINEDLDYDGIEDLILVRDRTTFGRHVTDEENPPHKYEVKLFKYGNYTSQFYKRFYSEMTFTGFRIHDNTGFYPRVKLFSLRYLKRSEELDYVPAEDFFFVYRGKINYAFTFIPLEKGCSTKMFFPNDEQGEENRVVMETNCIEIDGYTKKFVYLWDKRQFVLVRY